MRASGRARAAAVILYLATCTTASDYGIPIEIKLWDSGRTPLAHMVDVTNGFGLKVLAEHNFLNDNNIAFSPYGLMGILAALYEGVDGESSYQIQRGMALPWNRNVMRIGFRDIHRTLKTYFVPEEGFLAGLALNNENVTFNNGYKKILRFYGFDLDNDQLPTTTSDPSNSTGESSTMPSATASNISDSTTLAMTENTPAREDTSATGTREETTENPNAETIPSSAPNAESTTMIATTSEIEATTQTQTTSTTEESAISAIELTTASSTREIETTTSALSTNAALTNEPTANNDIDTATNPDSTSLSTTDTTAMTESSVMTSTDTSTQISDTATEETITTSPTDAMTTDTTSTPGIETLQRRKKSLVDFIYVNPPYVDEYLLRSYDIPLSTDVPNFDDTNFLANGLRNVQVSYMRYDTILDYAYLPHLEASALRLPLDSDRYYLLVVLPMRPGASEIGRLLSRMARESDLSDVHAALRPRRVRAIVPSFTVKGHVTLTTDLQKLGIRDVFEPRQRDFTPMTQQSAVYVRSIEQAVSVAIRKYQPDDQKKNSYVTSRHPVYFSATFPFLYFVMDSTINVALMAGKMVDPLNSRIL